MIRSHKRGFLGWYKKYYAGPVRGFGEVQSNLVPHERYERDGKPFWHCPKLEFFGFSFSASFNFSIFRVSHETAKPGAGSHCLVIFSGPGSA